MHNLNLKFKISDQEVDLKIVFNWYYIFYKLYKLSFLNGDQFRVIYDTPVHMLYD